MLRFYNYGLTGVIGFLVGQGIIVMWPDWSAWTWWGIALACVPLYAAPAIWSPEHWLRRVPIATIGSWAVLALACALPVVVVSGGIYYFAVVHDWDNTETVWTHPTLSDAEQERAQAECEMKAMEVGGNGLKIGSPRFEYETACLKSKGFALGKVTK